jgi:hypothetical protein
LPAARLQDAPEGLAERLLGPDEIDTPAAEARYGRIRAPLIALARIPKRNPVMIHLQLLSRDGTKLQSLVRQAIADDGIRSLGNSQVQGGLRIKHKKHQGEIHLKKTLGPLLATIICKEQIERVAVA